MIAALFTPISNILNEYLFGTFSAEKKIDEIREQFFIEDRRQIAQMPPNEFKEVLVHYIGRKEEEKAIDWAIRGYLVVNEHPEFFPTEVNPSSFIDFDSPLPSPSFACGRSLSHLSKILNLNNLIKTFFFISRK